MASQLANEDRSSSETSFVECETLPSRHYRKKCRKNNSFKTPIISKRLKTEQQTNLLENGNKPLENTTGEKKYALRKSNKKKSFDSNTQMEEIVSTDAQHNFKNDAKAIENETLLQNLSLHLIPEKVMKSLDKEFFPEETEEQHNLNMNCTEECTVEKQLISLTATNPPDLIDTAINKPVQLDANMNDNETATREIECGSRSQPKCSQIFSKITADNENSKKQTDTIGKNCRGDTTDRNLLDTLEHNEAYETNNNTKIVNKVTNDLNLDLLYVDINKADDIINSLAKAVDVENKCSINIHTSDNNSKQAYHLSKNDFVNESFYEAEDKNNFDINSVENNSTLNENSSEAESSVLSKNCQILVDEQEKNSFRNKTDLENKQNERKDETSGCSDIILKEGNPEAEFHPLCHKDINKLDMNSVILENQNKITEMLLKHDSSDQTSCKNEATIFPIEIDNSHDNKDFDNLYSSKIAIQNSHITVNANEDVADEIKKLTENLEVKQKKLTLLYMNALDYEKQNYENANEIMGKDSEITDESLHLVTGNESIDNITFSTLKNIEIPKQDLKIFSKEINEQNTKITEKDESKNEDKELKGYIGQNLIEMEKDDDFEMANTNETTHKIKITEKHDSKIENPIKYELTSHKEINKICDFQEESSTVQFHNKIITIPSISNNTAIYEANIEAIGFKSEEIEKCYKKTCIHEEESPFIVTAAECFQLQQNENSKEMESDGRVENAKILKEDSTSHEDVEGIFDMDDDFDLTASQINMIEVDENNGYKEGNEANSHIKRNCNETHFSQDSITVEIMDQLCYIRESVDSMKELLNSFLMKNEERK